MWTTKYFAIRCLIWLAALALPVQGFTAADCGCASTKNCCQGQSTACCCSRAKVQMGPCCCTGNRTADNGSSCCNATSNSGSSACNCGGNCQCGQDQQPTPATPPVENESSQKTTGEIASAVCVATSYQLDCLQRQHGTSVQTDSLTSLDRCACLCRFTL
jgi:hypothetical protein